MLHLEKLNVENSCLSHSVKEVRKTTTTKNPVTVADANVSTNTLVPACGCWVVSSHSDSGCGLGTCFDQRDSGKHAQAETGEAPLLHSLL